VETKTPTKFTVPQNTSGMIDKRNQDCCSLSSFSSPRTPFDHFPLLRTREKPSFPLNSSDDFDRSHVGESLHEHEYAETDNLKSEYSVKNHQTSFVETVLIVPSPMSKKRVSPPPSVYIGTSSSPSFALGKSKKELAIRGPFEKINSSNNTTEVDHGDGLGLNDEKLGTNIEQENKEQTSTLETASLSKDVISIPPSDLKNENLDIMVSSISTNTNTRERTVDRERIDIYAQTSTSSSSVTNSTLQSLANYRKMKLQ